MSRRKICVVTGTRADYGLLRPVMKEIQADPKLELQVVATCMHLAPEFGLTYRAIEEDGFEISAKVEMLLSSDTPAGISKSMGLGTIGFADALERLAPDLLLVLGDRFEILAAVQAALVARVPVAHIAGGDLTLGAMDESIRHAITKMAHVHFTTNEPASERIRQMGENPVHVHTVGSPGIDTLLEAKRMSRSELERDLGLRFLDKNLLITFHPATLDEALPSQQFEQLLDALDQLGPQVGLIFTLPNSDTHGRELIEMIHRFVRTRPHAKAFTSLGQARYLSVMAAVDCVVGNSSSGLYEAPSLGKATVNIGDRQKGRLMAESVISCECVSREILAAIRNAMALDCSKARNPYGDGQAARKIKKELRDLNDPKSLLKKPFFERNPKP